MERYLNTGKYGNKVINFDYFSKTDFIDDLFDGYLLMPIGKENYSIDTSNLKQGEVIIADERFDPILDNIRLSERRFYREWMQMVYNR